MDARNNQAAPAAPAACQGRGRIAQCALCWFQQYGALPMQHLQARQICRLEEAARIAAVNCEYLDQGQAVFQPEEDQHSAESGAS